MSNAEHFNPAPVVSKICFRRYTVATNVSERCDHPETKAWYYERAARRCKPYTACVNPKIVFTTR